jgi:hypothetical protein
MMMPGQPIPVDPSNPVLAETPAILTTAQVTTPHGSRMVLTIRTPSVTCTVFLNGKDAKIWALQITREAENLSDAGLIAGNGAIPLPDITGRKGHS